MCRSLIEISSVAGPPGLSRIDETESVDSPLP